MQNVILVVHLLLALSLIAVVLLQRSEGGGLGMGSGGGGGAMSARSAGTALGKLTWALAVAFIATSLTLTILAARDSSTGSVLDRLSPAPASSGEAPADDGLDTDGLLPPPSAGSGGSDGDGPIVPQAD
ncbi:preprotein translocase subunit SecG [Roseivivax halotolerans]|jgi:preprotein translocase subunit SecG|uniref:Protein-export membrane protein SecG n=1 Tax=Roseivivax halotolerans TaxID=93684 RepID=A0A1I5XXJ7_9RHOB|nr:MULTISPECIES: preprotein translocase subunit SecG [Roseivivax]QFT62253.1 Protein-export membrane protein SecG [Roseivivax sp. THAF30]SFQ36644.1 preprotein translocase subunit SecG [Roseivivax halotolerans]